MDTEATNVDTTEVQVEQTTGNLSGEDQVDNNQQIASEDAKNDVQYKEGEKPSPERKKGLLSDDSEDDTEEDSDTALGAPEGNYSFTNESGESVSDPMTEAFADVAKELNLSQQAVDTIYKRVTPGLTKLLESRLEESRNNWMVECQQDSEIGGEKFKDNLKTAKSGFSRFASDGLKQLLARTGLDSHPEVVKHFYRLEKQTGNPLFIGNSGAKKLPKSDPRNFYKGMDL